MKYYQILRKTGPNLTWEFVAHGARYSKTEAQNMVESLKARGIKAKTIGV